MRAMPILLLLVTGGVKVWPHHCGESPITLTVGQRAAYRITADVLESEESHYEVVINSDPSVASVTPDNFNRLGYGEFRITGLKPGTNTLLFEWTYAPNNASGLCPVEVRVVEPPADPRDVADQTTASEVDESGAASDPVNTYTGELVLAEPADLDLGGPMPVRFTRYYASGLGRQQLAHSVMGRNWQHLYEVRLLVEAERIDVVFHGGRVIAFTREGTAWNAAATGRIPYRLEAIDEGYLLLDPQRNWVYEFSLDGDLVRIEDTRGNALELTYAGGQLATVADGLGRTLTFGYTGFQQLASVSDGTRTVRFAYAGANLIRVTDRAGGTTRYEYDDSQAGGGWMTAKILPEGNSPNRQVYDAKGRVIEQTRAEGGVYRFDYVDLETIVTDPAGLTQRHRHDERGNLIELVEEKGGVIRSEFDAAGRRVRETARNGEIHTWSYHPESGELATATGPGQLSLTFERVARDFRGFAVFDASRIGYFDGTSERFEYDALGRLVVLTDRAGRLSRYTYNDQGRMLTATNAAGGVVACEYNADGTRRLVRRILPEGVLPATTFSYDSLRRLNRVEYPDGAKVELNYNDLDLVSSVTDEESATTRYEYSANSLLKRVTLPLGNSIRFEHDRMNEVTNVLDHAGRAVHLEFDALGRLTALVDRNGNPQSFQYDPLGRLTHYLDGAGQVWTQAHDVEGRTISQADPLGQVQRYTYDAAGRITGIARAPEEIRLTYDAMSRVSAMELPPGGVTSLTYAADGRLNRVALPGNIAAEYEPDALGLVGTVRDPNGQAWRLLRDALGRPRGFVDPLLRTNEYTLDERDRIVEIRYAGQLGGCTNDYTARGELARRTYSDGTTLEFEFDANGRLISGTGLALGYDAQDNVVECNGLTLTHDPGGRLTAVTVAPGKEIQYAYDARNLVTHVVDWLGGVTTFEYDAASRLVAISRPNGVTTAFGYDAAGRLSSILDQGTQVTASIQLTRDGAGLITAAQRSLPLEAAWTPQSRVSSYDAASQLMGADYDALGRMTRDGTREFEWDLASRLRRLVDGATAIDFEYDAFGSLLAQSQGDVRREYVWNYALRLRSPVVVREAGVDTSYLVHSPGGELLYAIAADSGARWFHHFDEMGNTTFLTDATGSLAAAYAHSPYGELLAREGSADTPFGHGGRYGALAYPAHGLVYLRHRWLDTRNGRFLTRDPHWGISIHPNELNPYGYNRLNPMRYVDPLGLDARVNQSGVHTDISVDVWQGDQIVGTLTVSYAAKGYRGNFGGVGEAFSTVIGGTQGEFSIDYKPGSIRNTTEPGNLARGTQIIIQGTREQDERLRLALAGIIGANGEVAFVGRGQSMIRQFIYGARKGKKQSMVIDATIDDWETYRALTQSCNDFTDAMLDIYFGENWYVGPIFEGDGLTGELRRYLDRPRGLMLDPNGIASITGATTVR
ncbi:MAG: hypothetical protein KJ072_13545 [Verrucomicrobia bacterium]|nr:hypothetical protein [Verrucomicrobiota bacterium]